MTSRLPTRTLVDVLRMRSGASLQRATRELDAVVRTLPADALQTRFLRNAALVSPASLCLLPAHMRSTTTTATTGGSSSSSSSSAAAAVTAALEPWGVFALYKPPFCPMRAADAQDNHHRVSVESFVQSVLRTHPSWTTTTTTARRCTAASASSTVCRDRVRVLNDVGRFASGPVLVHLSSSSLSSSSHALPSRAAAAAAAVTSLANYTMEYDVLVAGHLPTHAAGVIDASLLFPSATSPSTSSTRDDDDDDSKAAEPATSLSSPSPLSITRCTCEVRKTAYYAVHAVTLLTLRIVAPPRWRAPCIDAYVRTHLGTFVIGDPYATPLLYGARDASEATPTTTTTATHSCVGTMAMQGDCDFPRVFTHLREVRVTLPSVDDLVSSSLVSRQPSATTTTASPAPAAATATVLRFVCGGCFDSLLQPSRATTRRASALSLLDGAWSPDTHV